MSGHVLELREFRELRVGQRAHACRHLGGNECVMLQAHATNRTFRNMLGYLLKATTDTHKDEEATFPNFPFQENGAASAEVCVILCPADIVRQHLTSADSAVLEEGFICPTESQKLYQRLSNLAGLTPYALTHLI